MATDILGKLIRMLRDLQDRALKGKRRIPPPDEVKQVSEALVKLRGRNITVREYLAIKIDNAVRPLAPLLGADDVAFIRALLWERVVTDPVLSLLAERVTGVEFQGRKSLRNTR